MENLNEVGTVVALCVMAAGLALFAAGTVFAMLEGGGSVDV